MFKQGIIIYIHILYDHYILLGHKNIEQINQILTPSIHQR